ncbi:exopolyphosphatase [Thalassotalea ponticola]|uniref:Ppx/GppA phosphatase family protein n=1 Tax=Thalassotalea ponticola TaxID=1523392 RepID=UPI0025B4EC8C|nr:exopolyphosphatase [Thalassotalea ponticola]MDN3652226.1 exopolyphosphatase [Thalassotalea ponticola]
MSDNVETTIDNQDINAHTIAVADLGSNSFHLVLARIVANDVQILLREKIKVRLAQGLDSDLVLSEEAINRGLETLAIFADTLKGFHPDHVNIIATYTLRAAVNRNDFIKRAKSILPYPIQIISGKDEARLIYSGVAHSMHFTGKRLVIDIGGGSTEFALGQQFDTLALSSRNVGCVNLSNAVFPDGKISNKRFNKALMKVEQEIQPIVERYQRIGWDICIGTSGTASALLEAATANGYCDNTLSHSALLKLKKRLLTFKHFDDIDLDGINEDRKSVIVAGLAVMLGAFEILQINELQYNDKALREGALYDMEDQLQQDDIRVRSVDSLIARMNIDTAQADRVCSTCFDILEQVKLDWPFDSITDAANILMWAAKLHEIGLHINSSAVNKHSAYIVSNADLLGFSQEEQQLLTLLIRFYRKKIKPDELDEFTLFIDRDVCRLLAIFRLAVLFNQKRQNQFLAAYTVKASKKKLTITFTDNWLQEQHLLSADLQDEKAVLDDIDIILQVR